MLATAYAYLRARLSERSSQIQLVAVALVALVLFGVVSAEQLDALMTKGLGWIALAGPLLGILVPDPAKPMDADKVAAVLATMAAQRPEYAGIRARTEDVAAAIEALGLERLGR